MKKTLAWFFLLILAASGSAQTRRPATPRPQPAPSRSARKLVETVRTADGREVRLYDDMTYELTAGVTSPSPTMVTVNIKAGVITNAGDVKPVVRRDFLVFKEDIKPTLATVNDREGKPLDVFSFYLADEYRQLDDARTFNEALDKLKPITVATFTTDFQGNATVQLPNGDAIYWIYGSTQRVGRSSCLWYLQVIPSKTPNLVFDNNNASHCG
jgi:hypothetical protein